MDPDDRRASGTFYTPAALVERLVDAALTVVLAIRMGCSEQEAERRLIEQDPAAARVLEGITVLDPAVGSGAFLLGTLHRLSITGKPSSHAERKRRVLRQSLYGVDRNAAAVRLAELRLWLSVIADDPSNSAHGVRPLPNLDCLIRQGDSLFDPGGLDLLSVGSRQDPALITEISRVRKQVIGATGFQKRRWVRQLRQLEVRALGISLCQAEEQRRIVVAGYLHLARAPDLFGRPRGLDRELRAGLSQERAALRWLRQARRQLSRQEEVPWFHYRSAFADVFAQGGFDLVIGNPPWLRSEAIPSSARRQIAARYRWWKSRGVSYGKAPDLAIAFLERAFELARPGGTVAMLVPAKIATAGYGAVARHALASSKTLHVLANVTGTREAEFDATVYPLALVAENSTPSVNQAVRTSLSCDTGDRLEQAELRGGAPWILKHGGAQSVLVELEQQQPQLAENITCHLGVKTGLNQVFLNPPADIEPKFLRWALRGRDVRPFRCCPKMRLLWTHDSRGHPLSGLPPRAHAHLHQHADALRSRRDFQREPFWTVFRAAPAVARYRVVWSDLSRQLKAAALTTRNDSQCIPLNTCYVAPVATALKAHALAAWLNSTWIRAVAMLSAVPAAGGFFRFNAAVVTALPLPPAVLADRDLAQLALQGRAGNTVEREIDALVAQHLNLPERSQRALRDALGICTIDHR
jgi:Eco57I restriction-modification methylase/N-6 DNA Methylase